MFVSTIWLGEYLAKVNSINVVSTKLFIMSEADGAVFSIGQKCLFVGTKSRSGARIPRCRGGGRHYTILPVFSKKRHEIKKIQILRCPFLDPPIKYRCCLFDVRE